MNLIDKPYKGCEVREWLLKLVKSTCYRLKPVA